MKPAPFEYRAPATLRDAIHLLVSDPDAALIGQSLMPVLAFRLAAPSMLVDLRRVPGLDYIGLGDSDVRLGTRVRWRDIEDDRRLATAHPLLREAIAHVAPLSNPQPRYRRWQPRPCRPGRRIARDRRHLRCRDHPDRRRRSADHTASRRSLRAAVRGTRFPSSGFTFEDRRCGEPPDRWAGSILTGGTMIKNSLSFFEGAYPARKPRESARQPSPRLSLGPAFIVVALLSLGLWWGIWVAVSSLVIG